VRDRGQRIIGTDHSHIGNGVLSGEHWPLGLLSWGCLSIGTRHPAETSSVRGPMPWTTQPLASGRWRMVGSV
jgi:hypothetical protein